MTQQAPTPPPAPRGEAQPQGSIDPKAAAARSRALAASLGSVVAIMMRSPGYRNATLEDVESLVGPPLGLDQIAILEARDPNSGIVAPVAAVLWAVVSPEVDKRLSEVANAKPRLEPGDWRSGSIPWIITALGHQTALAPLLDQLIKARFADTLPKIRIREKDGTTRIGIVRPGSADTPPESLGTS